MVDALVGRDHGIIGSPSPVHTAQVFLINDMVNQGVSQQLQIAQNTFNPAPDYVPITRSTNNSAGHAHNKFADWYALVCLSCPAVQVNFHAHEHTDDRRLSICTQATPNPIKFEAAPSKADNFFPISLWFPP